MASIVAAVVVGTVTVLLPIVLISPTYQNGETKVISTERSLAGWNGEVKPEAFSSVLLQAGLLVMLGFAIALGVSFSVWKGVLA